MDEPCRELRADTGEEGETPAFEDLTPPAELVTGERTRDDFLDAVLGLDNPATADEVAELADHGTDAAREYLEWFERMGIVTQVTDTPATYRRNPEYFQWRRVQQLREEYETDELLDLLEQASDRDQSFAEEFDVETPEAVSISEHAAETEQTVESVWEAVAAWQTTRCRIALLERALATGSDESANPGTVV
jgi:predicted ArsR family transcriptional regulator